MKKLMFATALVASAAAFADAPTAINATSFEGYNAGPVIADKGDVGTEGANYFCFTGGDTDGSLVKTFGGDNLTAPSARAYYYASASNDKYLELSTEGGTLWRSINTIGGTANAYTLGAATNVAATGTYLDTLVQFTPTEDGNGPTDLDAADKLAIWLNVDQQTGATNLMVKAKYYFFNGQPDATETNYVLTAATGTKKVVAGEWYRLTIRAIPNVMSDDSQGVLSVFEIRVDGVQMCATTAPFDASEGGFGSMLRTMVPEALQAAYDANALFPSLAPYGNTGDTPTLQGVGFKGSGALDDIVWTEDDLFAIPAGIDFTLTWPAGLTASYQIGDGAPVSLANETVPFKVPGLAAGDVVKLFIQNADGATKMFTGTAGTDTALGATSVAFTWADYLGEAVDGAYEIDNLAELKLFQKGVANTNELTTANTTFKLTADVTLDEAWPGIGLPNGKDVYSTAAFDAAAFCGTFDGQNHTISGFQMVGVAGNPAGGSEGLDYCGFFNSTYGATIQNLKIAYAGGLFAADTTASTKESGATFVGVAKNSTLDNLTTVAGTVSCSKGFGGIVGYLTSGTTVQNCTNNLNMTSLAGNKCGGIAMITQGGSAVTISNCQNNGTQTTSSGNSEYGAIVGYVGLDVTIADCETTVGRFLKHQGNTVTLQGVNKGDPTVPAYHGAATPGLNFATVDGSTATFVADTALAAGNTYKVLGPSATATYEFAAAGSISFDTNLIQAVTFAITAAEGLEAPTETTANGVVTFTVAGGAEFADDGAEDLLDENTEVKADDVAEYVADITSEAAPTTVTKPMVLSYLLKANKILTTPETDVLKITAIEQVTGGWKITVAAALNAADVTAGASVNMADITGDLKVVATADLGTAFAPVAANAFTVTAGDNGAAVITVTDANAKFLKATVTK